MGRCFGMRAWGRRLRWRMSRTRWGGFIVTFTSELVGGGGVRCHIGCTRLCLYGSKHGTIISST